MFSRIVVPLDGSALAERAIHAASALARAFAADLRLVRVLEPSRAGGLSRDCVDWRLQQAEAGSYLDALAQRLRAEGIEVTCKICEGRPAEEIVRTTRDLRADLIVLCAHGRTDGPHSIGGTAQKIISSARTSLLLLRGAALEPGRDSVDLARIMVPVDCSPRAEWALRVAASFARLAGAELLVVHVTPLPDMPRSLQRRRREVGLRRALVRANRRAAVRYLDEVQRTLSAPDLSVRTVLETSGQVARTLNRIAVRHEVDLLVLSAHGLSGPSPWPFGSVAGSLVANADVPLLVLREAFAVRRRPALAGATTASDVVPDGVGV